MLVSAKRVRGLVTGRRSEALIEPVVVQNFGAITIAERAVAILREPVSLSKERLF